MKQNLGIDTLAINSIRTLVADAVQKAKSGHPGMAIGSAPACYALFNNMRINPANPNWQGRDRFVLSSGHASMLLYSLLHINGYDLSLDDIKNFRQLGSRTPGHPEAHLTPGVDATTGPLGQGFAMAVGMAMAEAHEAAVFNHDDCRIVDNYTYVLMGDGCMMEGASCEAASLAGTLKLGKLIAIYDSNSITIEGSTDIAFTENVAMRFTAYGFQVITVDDAENVSAFETALALAKKETEKPSLIIINTEIAHGTKKANQSCAHGEPLGDEVIADMKQHMGWGYPAFTVPAEVYEHMNSKLAERAAYEEAYNRQLELYEKLYPEQYKEWLAWHSSTTQEQLDAVARLASNAPEGKKATRAVSGEVLNGLYNACGIKNLFGGSADLGPSNKTIIKPADFFAPNSYASINIHFGVRELAMAAICNGIALYGGLIPFCATFMVFSDYVKPALRLSALMGLRVIYVMTHDSIGVGEDGATHHPIEQLASLRSVPNTLVIRPADYKETVMAYKTALSANCPTVLALSRQDLPQYEGTGEGALYGGYTVMDCKGTPDCIIIATGSELEIAIGAAKRLADEGNAVRVVSMPCTQLFDKQSDEYKERVLPKQVRARVVVEAGTSFGWHKYAGEYGEIISLDRFGESAPAGALFEKFGFTADNVHDAAIRTINKK